MLDAIANTFGWSNPSTDASAMRVLRKAGDRRSIEGEPLDAFLRRMLKEEPCQPKTNQQHAWVIVVWFNPSGLPKKDSHGPSIECTHQKPAHHSELFHKWTVHGVVPSNSPVMLPLWHGRRGRAKSSWGNLLDAFGTSHVTDHPPSVETEPEPVEWHDFSLFDSHPKAFHNTLGSAPHASAPNDPRSSETGRTAS